MPFHGFKAQALSLVIFFFFNVPPFSKDQSARPYARWYEGW